MAFLPANAVPRLKFKKRNPSGKQKSETLAIYEEAQTTQDLPVVSRPKARENQSLHQYFKKTAVDVPIMLVLGRKPYEPKETNHQATSSNQRRKTRFFCNFERSPILHCIENPIYVFTEKELCGLSPDSYIHVSVSVFCIPRIGPHSTYLTAAKQTDPILEMKCINTSQIYECRNWEISRLHSFISGNT
jgi:hypothetical protein